MRSVTALLAFGCLLLAGESPASAQTTTRPKVGVAFGGGSARGLAHIGVIQWFEENHIPIDVAAGTSMGGLVGGAFATGMSAAELRTLITSTDWDVMFGSSSFEFKNLRRKEDARSYPSRLEFGLKRGIVPPTSLNDGQQVDLFPGAHHRAVLCAAGLRRSPDAVPCRRGRHPQGRKSRHRQRVAGHRHAGDNVAARRVSAGRT